MNESLKIDYAQTAQQQTSSEERVPALEPHAAPGDRRRTEAHSAPVAVTPPHKVLEMRARALDSSSTHLMIIDVMARGWPIVYVNRTLAQSHGYEPDELISKSPTLLVTAEDNPVQLASINKAMRERGSIRTEVQSRRKNGTRFWAGILLEPVKDEQGQVTHYISTGADITVRLAEAQEKRRLQDQLLSEMHERERMAIDLRFAQKLEAVGRLAAGVAHEINTPIQYIGDSLSFLESGLRDLMSVLNEYRVAATAPGTGTTLEGLRKMEATLEIPFLEAELPKAIARAADGVTRVSGIVRAMKEFAHPDSAEHNPSDINHAIATTVAVSRGEYKHIASVETQFGDIPPVICNVGELNQVFLNLIVNAAHAIEAAGKDAATGRIIISTSWSGSIVEVTFSDNGCGIPEQNLEKIFDPFFTTKDVGKGSGQGLAIAHSIVVDKHGGSIAVNSQPQVGTRFCIRLPVDGRGAAGQ